MADSTPSTETTLAGEIKAAELQASLSDAKARSLENRLRSVRAQIDLIAAQKELQDLKTQTA